MEKNDKSLTMYIKECISLFNYTDFSPDNSSHEMLIKFEEILRKKNAYWEYFTPEDKWDNWIFIQMKTFTSKINGLFVGFNIASNTITTSLSKEITYDDLNDTNNLTKIKIMDIWLDHSVITEAMCEVIKKGILQSNT